MRWLTCRTPDDAQPFAEALQTDGLAFELLGLTIDTHFDTCPKCSGP